MDLQSRVREAFAPQGALARKLLDTAAAGDLASSARDRFVTQARQALPGLLEGPISTFVKSRAEELMQDHARLRAAAGSASRVTVEAVLRAAGVEDLQLCVALRDRPLAPVEIA